jgi:hypothetical protein
MERLQRYLSNIGGVGGGGAAMSDTPMVDTSEQVYISSLALLKMLKHGAPWPLAMCILTSRTLRARVWTHGSLVVVRFKRPPAGGGGVNLGGSTIGGMVDAASHPECSVTSTVRPSLHGHVGQPGPRRTLTRGLRRVVSSTHGTSVDPTTAVMHDCVFHAPAFWASRGPVT